MLMYKRPHVTTLEGIILGWYDGPTWRPSQVIVGMVYDEQVLSKWLKMQIRDMGLYQFGRRLATVTVGESGKIVNLTLDAQS